MDQDGTSVQPPPWARIFKCIGRGIGRAYRVVWEAPGDWGKSTKWIALAAAALIQLIVLTMPWEATPDSISYLNLARSLREGQGYYLLGLPHSNYPPGYPILLIPVAFHSGHEYWGIKLLQVAFFWLAGFATYSLGRRLLPPRLAGLVAMLWLLHPLVLRFQVYCLSDIPFTAILILALLAWLSAVRGTGSSAGWIALSVLAAAAVMVRAVGVVVGPALALATILLRPLTGPGRRWQRWVGAAALVAASGAGWITNMNFYTGEERGGAYLTQWNQKERQNAESGSATVLDLGGRMAGHVFPWLGQLGASLEGTQAWEAGLVFLPLVVWMLCSLTLQGLRHEINGMLFILALYSLAVLSWSSVPRFAIPMIPILWLLYFSWLQGEKGVRSLLLRTALRITGLGLMASTLVIALCVTADLGTRRLRHPEGVVNSIYLSSSKLEKLRILKKHIPPSDPVMLSRGMILREATGIPAYPIPIMHEDLEEQLLFWGIRYLVIKDPSRLVLDTLKRLDYRLITTDGGYGIYGAPGISGEKN